MRQRFALALLAAAIVTAACGGGGGTSSGALPPAANNPGGSNPAAAVIVSFTIKIPTGSSSSLRHPHYVSPGTQSIGVVVTNQGQAPSPAQYVNVSTCPQVSGVTTCSISVTALPGNDVFAMTAYSAPNGGGSALAVGSVAATIVAGVANVTDTLTLGGVVASIAITPGIAALPLGNRRRSTSLRRMRAAQRLSARTTIRLRSPVRISRSRRPRFRIRPLRRASALAGASVFRDPAHRRLARAPTVKPELSH